jgi:ATP-dependent RNA helicase MSS116
MPPPPKRKWHRPRPNGAAPNNGANPHSTATQQPKRPRTEDVKMQDVTATGPVDVKAMYSTSAGNAEAKRFSEMKGALDQALLNSLDKMGFEFMSPVQQKVLTELPNITSDCIVQAKTGTGKTVAFLLPAIQNLLAGNAPSAPPASWRCRSRRKQMASLPACHERWKHTQPLVVLLVPPTSRLS